MRKLLLLLTAVLCFSALLLLPAHAASFTEGVYTYTVTDGKATITKVSSASGDVIIPSTLGGYPVTAIDEGAFYWKNYLTTVVIPEGVTSIGEGAFQSCVKMTSVTLPDSLQSIGAFAFYDCSHLSSITIPKNVTSIGAGAFELCAWLNGITVDAANTAYCDVNGILYTKDKTELVSFLYSRNTDNFVIPEGVTSIGSRAFAQCFNLRGVTFPASLTAFAEDAFEDSVSLSQFTVAEGSTSFCVVDGALLSFDKTVVYAYPPCSTAASCTLPDGVTTIKANAFSRSTFLASLTLPDTVTTIGARAFFDCPALTSLTIPSGVTALEQYTFYGCSSLASVNIPEGVETLSGFLFRDCTSLTEITIPKSVTSIHQDAFYGCTALKSYIVNASNTKYSAVSGVLFDKNKTTLITYPAARTGTGYSVPSTVKKIGYRAFQSNTNLKTVTLPSGLTAIGESAFNFCSSLTSVNIPASVTEIGEFAFSACSSLTSAVLPSSLTTLNNRVFNNCSSLTALVIPKSVTNIVSTAVVNCPNLTISGFKSSAAQAYAAEKSISFKEMTAADPSGFMYTVADGKATIIGTDNPVGNITVPTTLGGYPVGALRSKAFNGKNSLTSVTIPACVTVIESGALANSPNLKSITVDSANPNYSSENGVLYDKDKTELILYPCGKEESSYTLPDSVVSVGINALYNCQNLTSIVVGENNTAYSSADGVLFNKDKTVLIQYPSGKTTENYTVPSGVAEIGLNAFANSRKLLQLTLPNSVNKLGESSFTGCSNLTTVVLPEGLPFLESSLFYGCASLTSVNIPEGAKSIKQYTFYGCTSLTALTIPSSVQGMDDTTFLNCKKLTIHGVKGSYAETYAAARNIPFAALREPTPAEYFTYTVTNGGATITAIDKSVSGALVIPETLGGYPVVKIDGIAAAILPNITSVHIPATVTALGNTVFYNCRNLTSITVDEANTKFSCADGVLFNKDKTVLIVYPAGKAADVYRVPDTVVSISAYGLSLCHSLKSLILPTSLQKYGMGALQNNASLESITVESGNAYYTSVDGILYSKDTSILFICPQGKDLGNYSVPVAVSTVAEEAFLNCAKLRGISFRAGLEYVDPSAFDLCSSLTTVSLPDGTSKIGARAFASCTALKSIYIPRSVTTIAADAFNGCTSVSVYGFPGSYAETFAGKNGIPFVMVDARKNLTVNVTTGASSSTTPLEGVSGTLIKNGQAVEGGSITIDEDSGKLIIPSTIPAGEYTIRFSKDKYVPRDYTIVIGETP